MRRWSILALTLVLVATALGTARLAGSAPRQDVRFEAVHVWLDAGAAPLAAYQVELVAPPGARIVGIEGGGHPAFAERPYFDGRAVGGERVIVAAFTGDAPVDLPRGRTRVATIHVQLTAPGAPEYTARVEIAATAGGRPIKAEMSLERGDAS